MSPSIVILSKAVDIFVTLTGVSCGALLSIRDSE